MPPFVLVTGFAKKCLIDYEPTFGDSFKRGKVVNVNPVAKTVTLHNGEKLEYDELVLATGTGGPFPAKLPLDIDKAKAIERYDRLAGLVSIVRKQHYCACNSTHLSILERVKHCGRQEFLRAIFREHWESQDNDENEYSGKLIQEKLFWVELIVC